MVGWQTAIWFLSSSVQSATALWPTTTSTLWECSLFVWAMSGSTIMSPTSSSRLHNTSTSNTEGLTASVSVTLLVLTLNIVIDVLHKDYTALQKHSNKIMWHLYISFQASVLFGLCRYICHGRHGPAVCEERWISCPQCHRAQRSSRQHQAEALGLSWGQRPHWQWVQHRPSCSGEHLFPSFCWVSHLFLLLETFSKNLNAEVHLCDVFQALLAMGSPETEYTAAIEAMRTSVRCNTYSNPMAMSQVLPALYLKSYLTIKDKQCLLEDGMWLLYRHLVANLYNVSV